jgi:transposase
MELQMLIRPNKDTQRIFLYRKPVDFGKYVNGLSAIVQYSIKHNPLSGDLYVFFNRAADKVRILHWEHDGFVLYGKYLEEDALTLPHAKTDEVILNGEQLNWLLDGIDINFIKRHKPRSHDRAC